MEILSLDSFIKKNNLLKLENSKFNKLVDILAYFKNLEGSGEISNYNY